MMFQISSKSAFNLESIEQIWVEGFSLNIEFRKSTCKYKYESEEEALKVFNEIMELFTE